MKNSLWFRNLIIIFIIPLIVGVIVAIVAFGLPKFFSESKELSYTIEGPISYLDDPSIGKVTIEINGVKTDKLYSYKARLWNSGNLTLKKLPIRFVFAPKKKDFKIFSVNHNTVPKYEFSPIASKIVDDHSRRFIYDFLHPKNEDVITFVTNKSPNLDLYINAEGVSIKMARPAEEGIFNRKYVSIIVSVIAFIGALLSTIIGYFFRKSEPEEIQDIKQVSKSYKLKELPEPQYKQRCDKNVSLLYYGPASRKEILNYFTIKGNLASHGKAIASSQYSSRSPDNLFLGSRGGDSWTLNSGAGELNISWNPPVEGQNIILINRTSSIGADTWGKTSFSINGKLIGVLEHDFSGNCVLIVKFNQQLKISNLDLKIQGKTYPGLAGIEIHA